MGVEARKEINLKLKRKLSGETVRAASKNIKGVIGEYKIQGIESAEVLQKLLLSDVSKLGFDIDWESVDWTDVSAVNKLIVQLLSLLAQSEDGEK